MVNESSIYEKPPVKIELAKPEDWEECKKLRLLAISGNEARMFGVTTKEEVEKEQKSTKEDWQKIISSEDLFIVLSWAGSRAVGIGRAIEEEKDVWRAGWAYTEKSFRNQGFDKKNLLFRIKEIIKRGGKKAAMGVMADNEPSLHIAESFGFKNVSSTPPEGDEKYPLYRMELDLTDKEVTKKINNIMI